MTSYRAGRTIWHEYSAKSPRYLKRVIASESDVHLSQISDIPKSQWLLSRNWFDGMVSVRLAACRSTVSARSRKRKRTVARECVISPKNNPQTRSRPITRRCAVFFLFRMCNYNLSSTCYTAIAFTQDGT